MAPSETPYLLTPTARRQLREAKAWSLRRWGPKLTEKYFTDLDDAARKLAGNFQIYLPRDELSGGTGLRLFPVREHFLVFEPLGKDKIAIVAVLRHDRDIPGILNKGRHAISRELEALRNRSKQSD